MSVEELVEKISGLTLLQTAELVKALEAKLGVSAAAPVAAAAPAAAAPAAGGAAAATAKPEAEVKTAFDVILKSLSDPTKKINVIKEVRAAVVGLGLAEAKGLVEGAPKTVREGVTKEEAEEIKKKLEAAGGVVEIQ